MLRVAANTSVTNTRSANVSLGSEVVHFSQATACTYTVNVTTSEVGFDGGTVGIALTTLDGCNWTATSTETWLKPQYSSGSGSDIVRYDVAPNSGGARHATATIGGQRITFNQAGRP